MKHFLPILALLLCFNLSDGQLRVSEIEPGTFPFAVLLRATDATGKTSHCGGAIIDRHWVVTAAHCVYKDKTYLKVEVQAGDTSTGGVAAATRKVYVPDLVKVHGMYGQKYVEEHDFDIALLRFRWGIGFNGNVGQVVMATQWEPNPRRFSPITPKLEARCIVLGLECEENPEKCKLQQANFMVTKPMKNLRVHFQEKQSSFEDSDGGNPILCQDHVDKKMKLYGIVTNSEGEMVKKEDGSRSGSEDSEKSEDWVLDEGISGVKINTKHEWIEKTMADHEADNFYIYNYYYYVGAAATTVGLGIVSGTLRYFGWF